MTVDEFGRMCNEMHGSLEEVNPKVHVCEIGTDEPESTELIFHEETGGAVNVLYDGRFGERADLETNLGNMSVEGSELKIENATGHIQPEGRNSQHYRDVDITIGRRGNFDASIDVL